MKKLLFIWIGMFVLGLLVPIQGIGATIYAPDGTMAEVTETEVETYLNLGWFSSHEEVVTTLYALDGRQMQVYKAEVPVYLALGWYATYEETVSVLYAPDGRQMQVYKAEVPTYLALGWYATYEETVSVLYAPDGRQMQVYKAEVPTYLALGWYETYDETVSTLYALDGRQMQVYKTEVPFYLSAGWFMSKEETVTTLYAIDGRQMQVYKTEVPTYLALGWYETIEETIETLYASGDRSIVVFKAEVPAYLAQGWKRTRDEGPMIALTFDDGPHGTYTDMILDTLEAYGARATFFVLGSQADAYPAQVKRAKNLGCDIGSHTYSHPDLKTCASGKIASEFSKTNAAVNRSIGESISLFRPPYGNHNSQIRSMAGVPTILWNIDTLDWKTKNAQAVAEHVLSHAGDGDIVLMHDIYRSTAEAVKIIVPELISRGYRLVTVRELAEAKGVNLSTGTAYYSF